MTALAILTALAGPLCAIGVALLMLALWTLSVPRVTVANVQPSDEQGVSWTAATDHG